MLSLGCVLISDLAVTNQSMHSLSGTYDSTVLGCTIFTSRVV